MLAVPYYSLHCFPVKKKKKKNFNEKKRIFLSFCSFIPFRKVYMLWFSFILGSNFIFLCCKLIIIYYYTQKQRKIKFKPKTKLNHNIYCYAFRPLNRERWLVINVDYTMRKWFHFPTTLFQLLLLSTSKTDVYSLRIGSALFSYNYWCDATSTLYKPDTSLKRTDEAGPEGVRLTEN